MPAALAEGRGRFIENNLGLVHSCANRFRGRGVEYDDLFQAGCVGLIKACDGFDSERGVMFSTYAVPVIMGEIKKIFRDGGTLKVSRRLKELSLKIARLRDEFQKIQGREPTVGELSGLLSESEELVAEAICSARPVVSLTADYDEDEGRELDLPADYDEEETAAKISLGGALERLEQAEREILQMRFYAGKTQAETASRLGTTQVQISRRERRIIDKLRGLMAE